MGFVKKIGKAVFGGGGGGGPQYVGYKSPYTENVDKQMFESFAGALGKVQPPTGTTFGAAGPKFSTGGQSPWGFGNTTFTTPYQPQSFKEFAFTAPPFKSTGYQPTSYGAATFTAPDLSKKGGLFSQMLGQAGSQMLRQQRGGLDEARREMVRSGTYSPAAMKNLTLEGQKVTTEGIEGMGLKGAYDLASEQAKYDYQQQLDQAAEKYKAAGFAEDQAKYMADQDLKLQELGAGAQQWQQAHQADYQLETDKLKADEAAKAKEFALKGGQLALQGEELGQKGEQLEAATTLEADQLAKDYFLKLLGFGQGAFVNPYVGQYYQPQGGGGFWSGLGQGLGGLAAGAIGKI